VIETKGTGLRPLAENKIKYDDEAEISVN